ncbi:hypothetical protein ACLB2K_053790 [Fragaria x ananassa]
MRLRIRVPIEQLGNEGKMGLRPIRTRKKVFGVLDSQAFLNMEEHRGFRRARILLRFKCVSKHWLSFISDPKFCHLHTLRNPNPSASAVFCNLSRYINFIPLDFDHDRTTSTGSGSPSCNPLKFIANLCHDNIKIIQSCNGLFLCHPEIILPSVIHMSDVRRVNTPLYHYVLNPTTNQFTKLVPPAAAAATTTEPRIFRCDLAFDPSKSPHYKVVFLWFRDEPTPCALAELY